MGFAEQLGMIGDDRKVQRPVQLDRPQRIPGDVVGLDSQRLSLCELVGVGRKIARALSGRVEGQGRVNVGVSEEGATQRVHFGAGLARFGAFDRQPFRWDQHRRDEADEQEQRKRDEKSGHGYWSTLSRLARDSTAANGVT